MSLEDMQQRAMDVAGLYDDLNRVQGRSSWADGDYVAGLVGDVGDLAKISLSRSGLKPVENDNAKFEHEIHDIVWSALVLAARNGLLLEGGFMQTMDQLESKIRPQLDKPS